MGWSDAAVTINGVKMPNVEVGIDLAEGPCGTAYALFERLCTEADIEIRRVLLPTGAPMPLTQRALNGAVIGATHVKAGVVS